MTEDFSGTISTTEAAERFQITTGYVTQLARKGVIKAKKLGRDWMIDENSLQFYLTHPLKRGPKLGSKHQRRSTP
jgi:excisionase family DNA binding protein